MASARNRADPHENIYIGHEHSLVCGILCLKLFLQKRSVLSSSVVKFPIFSSMKNSSGRTPICNKITICVFWLKKGKETLKFSG